MKWIARLVGVAALTFLAACETTGNPREGGLFGWSESKAKARQKSKQTEVAGAETTLTREQSRGDALEARRTATEQSLALASKQRDRTEASLRTQRAELVAKTERLEAESPTAATASRARAYRLKVNTIAAQTSVSPQQRAERLHAIGAEIDAALARLAR